MSSAKCMMLLCEHDRDSALIPFCATHLARLPGWQVERLARSEHDLGNVPAGVEGAHRSAEGKALTASHSALIADCVTFLDVQDLVAGRPSGGEQVGYMLAEWLADR